MNKKTINMTTIKVGDVIEMYNTDGIMILAKVEEKFKDDFGEITVITEMSNDKITLCEILQVYKQ